MKTPEEIAEKFLLEKEEQRMLAAEIRQALEAAREEGRREGWEKVADASRTAVLGGIGQAAKDEKRPAYKDMLKAIHAVLCAQLPRLPYNPEAFKTES